MSFWERFKNYVAEVTDPTEEPAERPPVPERVLPTLDDESAQTSKPPSARESARRHGPDFSRLGEQGGPTEEEALAALQAARGGEDEGRVLGAILAPRHELGEALSVACAGVLVARGEEDRAIDVLGPCSSAPALMLLSDLCAARGETARALGAIERVLARDLAAPGAIERHARLLRTIGAPAAPARRLDEATMVGSAPTDTPFRIEREVARGGAGSVYEAFDELLGRKVAFKVYHGGGEDRAALEREVRLAAKFAGPGVVRVLDASAQAGWVALEWAAQGSLRDWIRSGRATELLPIGAWALPLAHALARIHRAGFVHADVKPTNVLLQSPSAPLLSDFGIARAVGTRSSGGSAGYLSPERLSGAPASFADDVYGFGRTVEDVLAAAGPGQSPALEPLLRACLGPAASRPESGARLVELLAPLGKS
ncbi:MAG: protein kinase [Polyangiaceae bacterium]|nr:protein kinase [Polyangiaceae bacterium]